MFRCNAETQPQPGEKHNPEQARVMCIDAATSIAKLLQAYERRYGLRRINIQAVGTTCSAALLLIFAIVINHPTPAGCAEGSTPAVHLGTCFRALDESGAAWESAQQARDFLTLLQRRWEQQARKLRETRGSQSSGSAAHSDILPTKRPRRKDDSHNAESRRRRPWTWIPADSNSLDVDMNFDLDWMLMSGSSPLVGAGINEGSCTH